MKISKLNMVLMAMLALLGLSTCAAQARYRDVAFRADSLQAAADTARLLHLASLDSTTRAYERRIFQVELERDSIDRELDARPVVKLWAGVRVDTLTFTDTVVAAADSSYYVEQSVPPFTISGVVEFLPPQMMYAFDLIQEEDIPVEVRIECRPGVDGVNTASALLLAREPFTVTPSRIHQAQEVCNPSRPILAVGTSMKTAAYVAAGSILVWEGLKFLISPR